MSDHTETSIDQPPNFPPPKPRNKWKIVAIVLGSLVVVFILLAVIGSLGGDDRDEKLAQILPGSIEKNFRDNGVDVSVESVACDDLPTTNGDFTIECDVIIAELDQPLRATVQGSVDDDFLEIEEASSNERLLTTELAIPYVQTLVDEIVSGVKVMSCELGGDLVVISEGSEFTCDLDSNETVVITIASDGSGIISDVREGQGT